MKPSSLALAILLFALMLLPFWYVHRTENLNLGNIITGTYSSSWNTIWHYKEETNQNKTIFIWTLIFSIFAIGSFLNFFEMKLPLALFIGLIVTLILMLGLSFVHPTQVINNVGNYTK